MQDKAYKVLARQLDISNNKAKELIDKGVVYVGDKKVKIARALISTKTKFRVEVISKSEIIYEDANLIALNKAPFKTSEELEKEFNAKLIHRLDKETSGVLLLAKNDTFLQKAVQAFKKQEVKKIYSAWVEGIIAEEVVIDAPILVFKGKKAYAKVDKKRGKEALTIVKPDILHGKKTKVEVEIKSGRTHQIRVHLAYIGHPIVGDELYGSVTQAKRILLHAKKIELFGLKIEAPEPKEIAKYK